METRNRALSILISAAFVLLTHIFIGNHSFLFDFLIAFLIITLGENLINRFKSSSL